MTYVQWNLPISGDLNSFVRAERAWRCFGHLGRRSVRRVRRRNASSPAPSLNIEG
jgi:hypothetical protein